ncbi:diguanylate cyclase [Vibrio makurazakiensis]|uniref:sensor domain-containing diguanylate cyclase n=1 Tax=Vibrio makurazakiensis TaxID=2910250 RepID=UPI003D11439C
MNQQNVLTAYQSVNDLFRSLALGMGLAELNVRVVSLAERWFDALNVSIECFDSAESSKVSLISLCPNSPDCLQSCWITPIISSSNKVLGRITLNVPKPLSEDDRKLLQMLADFYGTALDKYDLEKELRFQAEYDSLTHCLNRNALYKYAENKLTQSDSLVGCFFGDVDSFKQINDQFGHEMGDAVLKQIGKVFNATFRDHGVCGRFGGDEFVGFYFAKSPALLEQFRSDLIYNLERTPILSKLGVTMSLGSATSELHRTSEPANVDILNRLVNQADSDMYRLKHSVNENRSQTAECS